MIRFSIRRWAAWAPGVEDAAAWTRWAAGELAIGGGGQPALAGMDPMLRRRAGTLGRLALEPLRACDAAELPIVFCSRHGEAHRGVQLLRSLAAREPLSPTEFSLSVHNAIGGLHSIAHASRAPVTAIAAGPASAAHGLVEACAQVAAGAPEVALVVYDAPLPEPYRQFRDETEIPYGWSWVIGAAHDDAVSLRWQVQEEPRADAALPPFGLELLRVFLGAARQVDLWRGGFRWTWTRHA